MIKPIYTWTDTFIRTGWKVVRKVQKRSAPAVLEFENDTLQIEALEERQMLSGTVNIDEGSAVTLNDQFQYSGSAAEFRVMVDPGDGTDQFYLDGLNVVENNGTYTISTGSREIYYKDDGNYDLKYSLEIDRQQIEERIIDIDVADVATVIQISSSQSQIGLNVPFVLEVNAIDPGDDQPASWTIDWGDGSVEQYPGSQGHIEHQFASVGVFNITATAYDGNGNLIDSTKTLSDITVSDPAVKISSSNRVVSGTPAFVSVDFLRQSNAGSYQIEIQAGRRGAPIVVDVNPIAVSGGQYLLSANQVELNLSELGVVEVSFRLLKNGALVDQSKKIIEVVPDGFQFEGGFQRTSVGELANGLAVGDNETGYAFVLYSEQDLFDRFAGSFPSTTQSRHLVAVRYDNGQWHYNANGSAWYAFQTKSTDRLIAQLDLTNDTATLLDDNHAVLYGIETGIANTDLQITPNQYGGNPDLGDFYVTGTYFDSLLPFENSEQSRILNREVVRYDVGNLASGLAAGDNETGNGFVLFSQEDVFDRIPNINHYHSNSRNLLVVRYHEGNWQFNTNGSAWHNFETRDSDRLIASLDFTNDTAEMIDQSFSEIYGINAGIGNHDLQVFANQFNGSTALGEFQVTGTYFEAENVSYVTNDVGSGNNYSIRKDIGVLASGLAVGDNEIGQGYVLYSDEDVFQRLPSINHYTTNSRNLLVVRYNNGQWELNTNGSAWYAFELKEGDRLIAALDFTNDTATLLEGKTYKIHGIDAGIIHHDLQIFADRFNGSTAPGEFQVTGTFFEFDEPSEAAPAITGTISQLEKTEIGDLVSGVAVFDQQEGEGFLLYSGQDIFSRFGSVTFEANISRHVIPVKFENGNWYFNDNSSTWHQFQTNENDRLIAKTNFSESTITSLEGQSDHYEGVRLGFDYSDLEFFADQYGGSVNPGEFYITGTYFADQKYDQPLQNSHLPTHFKAGRLHNGLKISESELGIGYVLYSQQNVHQRFPDAGLNRDQAEHFLVVRFNDEDQSWQYHNGQDGVWKKFTFEPTDRIVASIDFEYHTVEALSDYVGELYGIGEGFVAGDLGFEMNLWGGAATPGSLQITGTYFETKVQNSKNSLKVSPVSLQQETEIVLQFRNTDSESIDVKDVATPFGFELKSISHTTVAPGDQYEVVLSLKGEEVGLLQGNVVVSYETSSELKMMDISIETEVLSPSIEILIDGQPASGRTDFGVVSSGQSIQKTITITNNEDRAFTLEDQWNLPFGFSFVDATFNRTIESGETRTILVQYTGDAGTSGTSSSGFLHIGLEDTEFTLLTTEFYGATDIPRLEFSLDGIQYSDVPKTVAFGTVLAGNDFLKTIHLKNSGSESIEISEIQAPSGIVVEGFTGPLSLYAGQSASFNLRFSSNEEFVLDEALKIISDFDESSELPILLQGVSIQPEAPVLLNDTGNGSDSITSDGRILVRLASGSTQFQKNEVVVLVDEDGDGIADASFDYVTDRVVYNANLVDAGSFSRWIKVQVNNPEDSSSYETSWMQITGTYDPDVQNLAATLDSFQLSGEGVVGNQTPSGQISGTVSNDGQTDHLVVSLDWNGDDIADGYTGVNRDGSFQYQLYGIDIGTHTVTAKVLETNLAGELLESSPLSLNFEKIAYVAPVITNLGLKNDTGSLNDDNVTSDPTIVGQLAGVTEENRFLALWDSKVDGDFARASVVDGNGNFEFPFHFEELGPQSVYVKILDTKTGALGDSTLFQFTLVSTEAPTFTSFALTNDTGLSSDKLTEDPTLTGQVSSPYGIEGISIQFDHQGNGIIDGSAETDANGNFTYLPQNLSFGDIELRYRSTIFDSLTGTTIYGQWQTFEFTFEKVLDTTIVNFGLETDDGSGTTTDPVVAGTAMDGMQVSPFALLEFDLNGDNQFDMTAQADQDGQFSLFVDVPLGVESTVRVRARKVSEFNNQFYYGDWSSVTFTREAGQIISGDQNSQSLAESSQQHSQSVGDALQVLLGDAKAQFNANMLASPPGPGGGGPGGGPGGGSGSGGSSSSGFDLGFAQLSLGTNNELFGITDVDQHSIDQQSDQTDNFLVVGGVAPDRSPESGNLSINQSTADFSITGQFVYDISLSPMGEFVFNFTLTYTLSSLTGSGSIAGTLDGSFTKTAAGAFSLSETLTALGTISESGKSNTTDYQSALTTQNGTIGSLGVITYDFVRTETVDNSGQLDVVEENRSGPATGSLEGTFTENGNATVNGSDIATSTQTKTSTRDFDSTYDLDGTPDATIDSQGVSGSRSGTDDDSYSYEKDETGTYSWNGSSWEFVSGTFHQTVTSNVTNTITVSGSYTDSDAANEIYIGSEGISNLTGSTDYISSTVTFTGSKTETQGSTYTVNGTISLDANGNRVTNASYSLTANASINLSVTKNKSGTNAYASGTLTSGFVYTLGEISSSTYSQSGTYQITPSGTTVDATGSTTSIVDGTYSVLGGWTYSSPDATVVTSTDSDFLHHQTNTNNYDFDSDPNGFTNVGDYTIIQNTSTTGLSNFSETYSGQTTKQRLPGDSVSSPASVTGNASGWSQHDSTFSLNEAANYSISPTFSSTIGTFSKQTTDNLTSHSQGDLTYTRDKSAGTETNLVTSRIETDSDLISTYTGQDSGTFSLYFDGQSVLGTLPLKDENSSAPSSTTPSVISGSFSNSGTADTDSTLTTTYTRNIANNPPTGLGPASSSSQYTYHQTTGDSDSTTLESGNYTITDGVRGGSGQYTDTNISVSRSVVNANQSSEDPSPGDIPAEKEAYATSSQSFQNTDVTTTTNSTNNGTFTEASGITTANGNFDVTVITSGDSDSGWTESGPNYRAQFSSVSDFSSNNHEWGTTVTVGDTENFDRSGSGSGDFRDSGKSGTLGEVSGEGPSSNSTTRTGQFDVQSNKTTDTKLESYRKLTDRRGVVTTDKGTTTTHDFVGDNSTGNYQFNPDQTGSRTVNFDTETQYESKTDWTSDEYFNTPNATMAAALIVPGDSNPDPGGIYVSPSQRGYSYHKKTKTKTEINRNQDGTMTETYGSLGKITNGTGNFDQTSTSTENSHSKSHEFKGTIHDGTVTHKDEQIVDSVSKSFAKQEDQGTLEIFKDEKDLRSTDQVTETGTRKLTKNNQTTFTTSNNYYNKVSETQPWSKSQSTDTTTNHSKYFENGTYSEIRKIDDYADGSSSDRTELIEASGVFIQSSNGGSIFGEDSTVHQVFRENERDPLAVVAAGGGRIIGENTTRQITTGRRTATEFQAGTFTVRGIASDLGTYHYRSGVHSSKNTVNQVTVSNYDGWNAVTHNKTPVTTVNGKPAYNYEGKHSYKGGSISFNDATTAIKIGTFTDSSVEGQSNYSDTTDYKSSSYSFGGGNGTFSGENISGNTGNLSGTSRNSFSSSSNQHEHGTISDNGVQLQENIQFDNSAQSKSFYSDNKIRSGVRGDEDLISVEERLLLTAGSEKIDHKEWNTDNESKKESGNGSRTYTTASTLSQSLPPIPERYNQSSGTYTLDATSKSESKIRRIHRTETHYEIHSLVPFIKWAVDHNLQGTDDLLIRKGENYSLVKDQDSTLIFTASGNGDGTVIIDADYNTYNLTGKTDSVEYNDSYTIRETSFDFTGPDGFYRSDGINEKHSIDKIIFHNNYTASSPNQLIDNWVQQRQKIRDRFFWEEGSQSGEGSTVVLWGTVNSSIGTREQETSSADVITPDDSIVSENIGYSFETTADGVTTETFTEDNSHSDDLGPFGSAAAYAAGRVDDLIDWAVEQKEALLDALQYTLDIIGLIPGFGNIADGINAYISYQRGDYWGAALSAAAAAPVVGIGIGVAKIAGKTVQFAAKTAKYVGKSAKAFAGSSKIASRVIDVVQGTAKRASNFVSNAWDGAVQFKRRVVCEWTGNGCFVEGTEVLIFSRVPEFVEANWQPVEVPQDLGQANGRRFAGAWIAMSVVGVVIVLAKEKRKRNPDSSDPRKEFSTKRKPEDSSPLPEVSEQKLFSLQCSTTPTTDAHFSDLNTQASKPPKPKAAAMDIQMQGPDSSHNAEFGTESIDPVNASSISQESSDRRSGWRPSLSTALTLLFLASFGLWNGFVMDWNFLGSGPQRSVPSYSNLETPVSVTGPDNDGAFDPGQSAEISVPAGWQISKLDIKKIQVGMRVPALNPLRTGSSGAQVATKIDPPSWRKYRIRIQKTGGGSVDIETLRPASWIENLPSGNPSKANNKTASVAKKKWMEIPELNVQGFGKVLSISRCPEIFDGPGQVVTSTFHHTASKILDLKFQSDTGLKPSNTQENSITIGVTANHPFWSETVQEFVAAGDLNVGDLVSTIDHRQLSVTSINTRKNTEPVFNFEVAGEHVYYVSNQGILVHNMCAKKSSSNNPKNIAGNAAESGGKKAKDADGLASAPEKVLSSKNPIRTVIREAYEEIKLGRGTPRLNPDNTQKVFQARELKRISGSSRNRWEGALEFEVPGTNHRILKRTDGVLGYVENHDYSRIRVFPKPWYPDGY